MLEIIKEWVITNFGLSALVLLCVLALAIYVGGWLMKFKKDIQNLPCEEHKRTMEHNTERMESTDTLLHRIEGQVTALPRLEARIDTLSQSVSDRMDTMSRSVSDRLDNVSHSMSDRLDNVNRSLQILAAGGAVRSNLTQSHSPISLSDKGRVIANEIKLHDIVDANWDSISSVITDQKNPYDIQMEFIMRLIIDNEQLIDPQSLDLIKTDAFMRGIPLIEYMRMAGIIARDRFFKEHGIDIADIDRHTPSAI